MSNVDLTPGTGLTQPEIEAWLREDDPERLNELWLAADDARRRHVGDTVHLRGLLEISNYCVRECAYCGLRAGHRALERYRMTRAEILEGAREAQRLGFGTIVLQAGEDYGITAPWLADVIRTIKAATPLAVTLSLGERPAAELEQWRAAGADRYLLRFETGDPELYRLIHPPRRGAEPASANGTTTARLTLLNTLRELGYEVGSGVMVGIPGQAYASLAADIACFRRLDLDMIGVGPYISHPATPLGSGERRAAPLPDGEQVPNDAPTTLKVLALTRLACPEANLPSTTALATIDPDRGRELGLMRGANVVMPNLTPPRYRALYEIYPGKACPHENDVQSPHCLLERIRAMGREVGEGPGGRARAAR